MSSSHLLTTRADGWMSSSHSDISV